MSVVTHTQLTSKIAFNDLIIYISNVQLIKTVILSSLSSCIIKTNQYVSIGEDKKVQETMVTLAQQCECT